MVESRPFLCDEWNRGCVGRRTGGWESFYRYRLFGGHGDTMERRWYGWTTLDGQNMSSLPEPERRFSRTARIQS